MEPPTARPSYVENNTRARNRVTVRCRNWPYRYLLRPVFKQIANMAARYTPVSGPVLSEMLSTFTPTFSISVSPRFMNAVCIS